MNNISDAESACRLDRWLWAARFFRTRGLAKAAIVGGKVQLNGTRAKPAKTVQPRDLLEIRRDEERWEVVVEQTGTRRVSAELALKIYSETAESRSRREAEAEQRRLKRLQKTGPDRRPDKRDRRALRRFKGR